jgi:hypothetical protein
MKSNPDLNTIAGLDHNADSQWQRDDCIAAFRPIVRKLLRKNIPPDLIVAALTEVTFRALGRDKSSLN